MSIIAPQIVVEGPDKCGKDSLITYMHKMSNFKYCLNSRGILSQLVYNDKYKRNNSYILSYKPLIIFLTADEVDQNIRCDLTFETKIDFNKDLFAFNSYAKYLNDNGLAIVWEYNTSHTTLFDLSRVILNRLEEVSIQDFIVDRPKEIHTLNIY